MIGMDVRMALASMKSTKLRSALTMVAIVIGVTGYVLVTTFVDGLKVSVTDQFDNFGGNLVVVLPGDIVTEDEEGAVTGFDPIGGAGASTLTELDANSIKEIEGVEYAAPQVLVSGKETVKTSNAEAEGVLIIASNEDYLNAINQELARGDFFREDEDRKVAVIGSELAEEMFPAGLPLGSLITIRGEKFTIIGLQSEIAGGDAVSFGADPNRNIIIPLEAGRELTNGATSINEIDIQVAEEADIDAVVLEIETVMLENHGGTEDFTVLKQEDLIDLTGSVLDSIKVVSQSLSYVMLFVGGVVIALIMLITVKERTKEIGIRKSIGATNANIRTQFLVEAVVISWFGAVIGVIVAYLAGLYVANISDITPSYTVSTLVQVVVIATIIGAISGIIPAMSAAKKDPVDALRSE